MDTGTCFNAADLARMADWSQPFDDPIPLPGGIMLRTLADADLYVDVLPEAEQQRPEWRTAAEMLAKAAEAKASRFCAGRDVAGAASR